MASCDDNLSTADLRATPLKINRIQYNIIFIIYKHCVTIIKWVGIQTIGIIILTCSSSIIYDYDIVISKNG